MSVEEIKFAKTEIDENTSLGLTTASGPYGLRVQKMPRVADLLEKAMTDVATSHRRSTDQGKRKVAERAQFLARNFGLNSCPRGSPIPVCPPIFPPPRCEIPCVSPAMFNFLQLVTNSNKNAYLYTPGCYLNAASTVVFSNCDLKRDREELADVLATTNAKTIPDDVQTVSGLSEGTFTLPDSIAQCELNLTWTTRLFVQNLFIFDRVANDDCKRLPPYIFSGRLLQFYGWPTTAGARAHTAIPFVSYLPWCNSASKISPGEKDISQYIEGEGELFVVGGLTYLVRATAFQMVIGGKGTIQVSVYQPEITEERGIDGDPDAETVSVPEGWRPFATGSVQGPLENGFLDLADCFRNKTKNATTLLPNGLSGKVYRNTQLLFTQSIYVQPCTWLEQAIPVASVDQPVDKGLCLREGVIAMADVYSPQAIVQTIDNVGQP
eukprot:g1768.t1